MKTALTAFRRDLHANPELSGHERETQKRIKEFLARYGINKGKDVGRYGTLYDFHFGEGPSLLVRVDIDALSIDEVNTFEHASRNKGVSHKCGHDGHTAIGAGLAVKLHNEALAGGSVSILFQPSEENGEGARGVIEDKNFHIEDYDFAVALHNIPGAPLHEILWKHNNFTPAVHSLVLKLKGRTSHAAQPLKGKNPTYAIAEIVRLAQNLENTDEQAPDYRLITPVFTHIGSKDYGISAGYGEIHFTIRSWQQEDMEHCTAEFLSAAETIAREHELTMESSITAAFASNMNNPQVVVAVVSAANQLGLSMTQKSEPFAWGEDFGLFTQLIPGAMFGLGSGVNTTALHNPDYDYPDEITSTGINMFYEIAKSLIT